MVALQARTANQKFRTTMKTRPVRNESFYLNVSDPSALSNRTLEASVYHFNRASNSSCYIGEVPITATSFVPYSVTTPSSCSTPWRSSVCNQASRRARLKGVPHRQLFDSRIEPAAGGRFHKCTAAPAVEESVRYKSFKFGLYIYIYIFDNCI